MQWQAPLVEGKFLKRYKRFFADVQLGGEVVVAHVANTGSLKSCNDPESLCWMTPSDNPERKLKFSLQAIQARSGAWVGVNTSLPNALVAEAFRNRVVEHWREFEDFKAEVKLNKETRLDFCFFKSGRKHFVEVKNVTLLHEGRACFPDAVSERGQKHLREMIALIAAGHTAEIVFVIQRGDCRAFSPADHIDPEYGRILRQAVQAGVRVTPLVADVSVNEIVLTGKTLELQL